MLERVTVTLMVAGDPVSREVDRKYLAEQMRRQCLMSKQFNRRPGEEMPLLNSEGKVIATLGSSDRRAVLDAIVREIIK